jgi:hypothetical protein
MVSSLRWKVIGSAAALLAAAGCGGGAKPATTTAPPSRARPLPMVAYQPTAAKDEAPREEQELTPENIVDFILSKYKAGLERCHEELLVRQPSADGRVALSFTVDPGGHVVTPKVKGFDAGIDDCIAQRANAWTFPPPKGKGGAPTSASFEVTLKLDGQ